MSSRSVQLTLVSHYGDKPREFAWLIDELQTELARRLGASFVPYEVAQVHGTIIGFEGTVTAGEVQNENFAQHRGENRLIDFGGVLRFLRSRPIDFTVRIGGFAESVDYRFTSQGAHPFARSFALRLEIAVAMGWPFEGVMNLSTLNQLRRQFQKFGVLHKWHRSIEDVDNDFFFVLGRIGKTVSEERRLAVEREIRECLARRTPLHLPITKDTLSFVAYRDAQLPLASSRWQQVTDASLTPERLRAMYLE